MKIKGYRTVSVHLDRQYMLVQRESDGVYGYLWLWSYEFTPMGY